MGNIGADKTRVIITLPIDLKEKLNNLAKDQNRTLTNLVVTILMEYVKSQSRH
jgi:predicted DNA-binding protein